MNKRYIIFFLVIFLGLMLFGSNFAHADGTLKILSSSVDTNFPYNIKFSISTESNVEITDIRLHYTIERDRYAQVISEVYLEFKPDTRIDTDWTWNMIKTGGLPPESYVEYWWTIKDSDDNELVSNPTIVTFSDDSYSWQSLTEGKVTVYWYKGDESFAEELMSTAQESLVRLSEGTGAYLTKPVKIYIYANSDDLQGAMVYPQEWTGGVAYSQFGIIAIGISPNNLTWGLNAITHELTHLVIHQMTYNPYNWLPVWLNEGLAMYNQETIEPVFIYYLEKALRDNTLLSVRSLSSPFSADAETSYLSYAQSYSLIEYLISTYGQNKMLKLLNTFKEGSGYDGALLKVYGFDMDNLNDLWLDYMMEQYQENTSINVILPDLFYRPDVNNFIGATAW